MTIAVTKFADNKLNVPNSSTSDWQTQDSISEHPDNSRFIVKCGCCFCSKSQAGGGSPILRGFEANKVLIVVDDVRMNNAIFKLVLQNILRVDNNVLERAEVVYGTGSLVYEIGLRRRDALSPYSQKLNLDGGMKASGGAMLRYGTTNNEMTQACPY
ncbi:MAG: TonB-dependent receptor plug domain-containing protein [Sphingobacteriales bacterium]|nr:TonB-dependent receptor plug domain-containing protein [Sphingobacteriales bacterium]